MSTLGYILLFSFIGSIGSLVGGIILLSKEKLALRISHFLAAFAAGTLLGTSFFDLLPEAARAADGSDINIFVWVLAGFIIFFLLERFIHWYHHHDHHLGEEHEEEEKSKHTIPLIIIGDTLHNFIDGVVIAATFMVNIPLGIITSLSVAAHEVPQEIGDFGLLMHRKMPRKRIIAINVLSGAMAMVGAVVTYFIGNSLEKYLPILLATASGFFIYIAASDIIPEIHHEKKRGTALIQSLLLLAGIAIVGVAVTFLEGSH